MWIHFKRKTSKKSTTLWIFDKCTENLQKLFQFTNIFMTSCEKKVDIYYIDSCINIIYWCPCTSVVIKPEKCFFQDEINKKACFSPLCNCMLKKSLAFRDVSFVICLLSFVIFSPFTFAHLGFCDFLTPELLFFFIFIIFIFIILKNIKLFLEITK